MQSTTADTQSIKEPHEEVRVIRPFLRWLVFDSIKDAYGWVRHPKERFRDFKVRYSKPEPLIAWQLSSLITGLQFMFGAKLWAWLTLKFPTLITLVSKFGLLLKTVVVKLFQGIALVFAAIVAAVKG